MAKITKTITFKYQEVASLKSGVPIDKDVTIVVNFPIGDLVISNGKMTFNTKR